MGSLCITIPVVLLGEVCLLLDLGNRLFGSYARTPGRMLWRIVAIVLAGLALPWPLLQRLAGLAPATDPWLAVSTIASLFLTAHYLFPCRFGIRRSNPPGSVESHQPLTTALTLHRIELAPPLVPAGQPETRILVLSDLHANTAATMRTLADGLAILAPRRYDLVLILGDLGERAEQLPELLRLVAGIAPRQGTFLVRGNHDCERGRDQAIARLAQELAITILGNTTHPIPELELALVGLEHPWKKGPIPARPEARFAIGLSHTPDNLPLFARLGIPLALAGHTHGGKLHLPGLGPLLVSSGYGRVLTSGWYRLGPTWMQLTPGLGYFPGALNLPGTILELEIHGHQP